MQLYDTHALAKILSIGERAVTRLIRKGQIPAQKIGQKWYVSEQAFEKYLEGFSGELDKETYEQLKKTVQAMQNYYKILSPEERKKFKSARKEFERLEEKVNKLLREKERKEEK